MWYVVGCKRLKQVLTGSIFVVNQFMLDELLKHFCKHLFTKQQNCYAHKVLANPHTLINTFIVLQKVE